MEKFSHFLLQYAGVLSLVYNTARSAYGTYAKRENKFREVGLVDTESFAGGLGEGLVFFALDQVHTKWLLPIPDVLILERGSHVESNWTSAESGFVTMAECEGLNDMIMGWVRADFSDLQKLSTGLQAHFGNWGYNMNKNCLTMVAKRHASSWSAIQSVITELQRYSPGFPASFAPQMTPLRNSLKITSVF